MTMYRQCPGCLAQFPTSDTDILHSYIGASSECWAIYTQILAKEYEDKTYFKVHRVTVDAYCAQHIGDQSDRRARQSANGHLIALYLTFGLKLPQNEALVFLQKAMKVKKDWPARKQIANPHWLAVKDIVKADSYASHEELVMKWGQSVWDAYRDCHDEIIEMYKGLL